MAARNTNIGLMKKLSYDQRHKLMQRIPGRLLVTLKRSFPWFWREGPASQPLTLTEPPEGWPIVTERAPEPAPRPSAPDDDTAPHDSADRRAAEARRRAAIIAAFDASHPIQRRDDLADRSDTMNQLLDAVLEGRQHAILHGPRGSGKTSLARVFGDYADQQGATVLYMACEPTQSFADLIRPYLNDIPRAALRPGGAVDVPSDDLSSPRGLVALLAENVTSQVVFIFDEFDRITDQALQGSVATTMKLLSDARVPVQFMLVGIAQSVDGLIAGHASLRRHLVALEVGLLSDQGVRDIIDRGSKLACTAFAEGAREAIAQAACGSPYHVQLFCQSAGIEMIRQQVNTVSTDVANAGLALAAAGWGRLNRRDHALFQELCTDGPSARAHLFDLLTIAIKEGGLTMARLSPDHHAAADRLARAVTSDPDNADRKVFQDTLAPPFLRAMLILSDDQNHATVVNP